MKIYEFIWKRDALISLYKVCANSEGLFATDGNFPRDKYDRHKALSGECVSLKTTYR